jgi:hypothetical protein
MIGKFFKKITGIERLQQEAEEARQEALQIVREAGAEAKRAIEEADNARADEEIAKMSPKERATKKGEPWVGVLETHVNKENLRNGFFELDWNSKFIEQLVQQGFGTKDDKEEEVVDRWFRELCANVVVESGFDLPISTGSIDPATIKKNS